MKKSFLLLLCVGILIDLPGCSSTEENTKTTVDIMAVVQFTDEQMQSHDYTIIERTVSQRTDDITLFIVEYLYEKDDESGMFRYGYYLKMEGEILSIISEGKDVNKSILKKKEGV